MKIIYRNLQKKNRNNGQSLFELIMSIGVSALIIVAVVALVNNAIQNAAFSKNETQASKYAQAATEWLRGQRDNRIDTFIANSASSWCLTDPQLNDTSWDQGSACLNTDFILDTIFVRQVDFTTTTESGKKIIKAVVTVNWKDSKGTHTVNSATNFTDWREI